MAEQPITNSAAGEHIATADELRLTPDDISIAATIADSPSVVGQYAACEWDSLHDDGKMWVAAIVRAARAWDRSPATDAGKVEREDFLAQLRRVNLARYEAWVDGADAGIMFDAVELGGEVGELLNVVKKLEREEKGWRGSRAKPQDFADECADVLICLDKLARRRGVDLVEATVAKFNATSDKQGFPHRLASLSSASHSAAGEGDADEDDEVEAILSAAFDAARERMREVLKASLELRGGKRFHVRWRKPMEQARDALEQATASWVFDEPLRTMVHEAHEATDAILSAVPEDALPLPATPAQARAVPEEVAQPLKNLQA